MGDEEYVPHFDRLGTTRRVLGHVTDEPHFGFPRNTVERLQIELAEDPHTEFEAGDDVQPHLAALVDAKLLKQREDGSFEVTDAGRTELDS